MPSNIRAMTFGAENARANIVPLISVRSLLKRVEPQEPSRPELRVGWGGSVRLICVPR
jgi:hypothetical protein